MILFWNNTYYGELAKGSTGNTSTRAEMFHPIPAYYYVINYIVGLVFMASFFVGVGLNPFVIRFNWTSKRGKLTSRLFIANAGTYISNAGCSFRFCHQRACRLFFASCRCHCCTCPRGFRAPQGAIVEISFLLTSRNATSAAPAGKGGPRRGQSGHRAARRTPSGQTRARLLRW